MKGGYVNIRITLWPADISTVGNDAKDTEFPKAMPALPRGDAADQARRPECLSVRDVQRDF